MIDLQTLKNSGFFTTWLLKSWEVLFDEWNVDNFLYIIESGKLAVKKYTWESKTELKTLAILEEWSIFWEASLTNSNPKEVRISALEDTKLWRINWQTDFEKFLQKYPREWMVLLTEIIDSTNKRLLEANFLITSSYTIIKYISQISEFSNRNLFWIIEEMVKVISADYIKYVEKNPVLGNVFITRYDTRNPWKMQEMVLEIDDVLDLKELSFKVGNILVENLQIWDKIIWYLIIWSKKSFSEWQRKSISMIAVSIASFVKQKQNLELMGVK